MAAGYRIFNVVLARRIVISPSLLRWNWTSSLSCTETVAPNGQSSEDSGGYEWRDGDGVRQALLIADETALPAAAGILEQLAKKPHPPRVQAFFSVPLEADIRELGYSFAEVRWLARDRGDDLLAVVEQEVTIPAYAQVQEQTARNESLSETLLWESASEAAGFQAWVAAESTLVKNLRHNLIEKQKINRGCVSFMAYWAQGKV